MLASAETVKGWFKLPHREGDRTIEQQMLGLGPALRVAFGSTILDLGSAEGLVSREFLRAGATSAVCVEIVNSNAEEAERQLRNESATVINENVETWLSRAKGPYDIVLALAILHKLKDPTAAVRHIARLAGDLIVVRLPPATPGFVLDARSGNVVHDVTGTLRTLGWGLSSTGVGPLNEWIGFFARA